MSDPPRRTYHGGLVRELLTGQGAAGLHRHHLISQDSLKAVELKLGITLDPDDAPGILIADTDHENLWSTGRGHRRQIWREQTTRLLLEGKWDVALDREIGDVERAAPGKYTAALEEARRYGKALLPEHRSDQLPLDLETKQPRQQWSPTDPPPGWNDWKQRWREELESSEREKPEGGPRLPPPSRRPDRDRGIGD